MKIIKRIISMILVVSLLISMTGCSLIQVDTEALLKGLHEGISGLTLAAILFPIMYVISLFGEGDEEPAILDTMRSWWDDIVHYDRKKETVPETEDYTGVGSVEVEQEKYYGDESAEEKKEKSWLAKLWERFTCDHDAVAYRSQKITVSCICGKTTCQNLTYDEFKEYVPEEDLESLDETSQFIYLVREYRRYYGVNQQLSPETMAMILNQGLSELDDKKYEQLSTIAGFFSDAADKMSTYANLGDKVIKQFGGYEYFKYVDEYFGLVSGILSGIKTGVDIANVDKQFNDGGSIVDKVNASVELIEDLVTTIPFEGVIYSAELAVIKPNLEKIVKNIDIYQRIWEMPLHENIPGLFGSMGNLTQENWANGPSLTKIASADLSPEELCLIYPYIEYRFNLEITEIFNVTLEELLNAQ